MVDKQPQPNHSKTQEHPELIFSGIKQSNVLSSFPFKVGDLVYGKIKGAKKRQKLSFSATSMIVRAAFQTPREPFNQLYYTTAFQCPVSITKHDIAKPEKSRRYFSVEDADA